MVTGTAGGSKISERFQESLARLRQDIERVEVWAGALEGFSRPIPDYDAARRYRLASKEDGLPESGDKKSKCKIPLQGDVNERPNRA
jgi:hypothetical protein